MSCHTVIQSAVAPSTSRTCSPTPPMRNGPVTPAGPGPASRWGPMERPAAAPHSRPAANRGLPNTAPSRRSGRPRAWRPNPTSHPRHVLGFREGSAVEGGQRGTTFSDGWLLAVKRCPGVAGRWHGPLERVFRLFAYFMPWQRTFHRAGRPGCNSRSVPTRGHRRGLVLDVVPPDTSFGVMQTATDRGGKAGRQSERRALQGRSPEGYRRARKELGWALPATGWKRFCRHTAARGSRLVDQRKGRGTDRPRPAR